MDIPIFGVSDVSFEDEKTFELLNEAKTIGVFQLESDGMRRLCRQMTITNVDEIIALIVSQAWSNGLDS